MKKRYKGMECKEKMRDTIVKMFDDDIRSKYSLHGVTLHGVNSFKNILNSVCKECDHLQYPYTDQIIECLEFNLTFMHRLIYFQLVRSFGYSSLDKNSVINFVFENLHHSCYLYWQVKIGGKGISSSLWWSDEGACENKYDGQHWECSRYYDDLDDALNDCFSAFLLRSKFFETIVNFEAPWMKKRK